MVDSSAPAVVKDDWCALDFLLTVHLADEEAGFGLLAL
jgi:hypothetical protein